MSQTAQRYLLWGLHASRSDFSALPGTLYPLDWQEGSDLDLDQPLLDRGSHRPDAEPFAKRLGAKTQRVPLQLEMTGGAPADGTSIDRLTETECQPLIDLHWGADATANGPAGTPDTAVSSVKASRTLTLDAGAGARFPAGSGILFPGGPNGTLVAREVVSVATDTLTLDRTWDTELSGGETVYPALTTYLNPREKDPIHAAFVLEGALDNAGSARIYRREVVGCAPGSLTYNLPADGGLATLGMEFEGSHWTRETPLTPAVATATKGGQVLYVNSPFYIGDQRLCVADLKITVEVQKAPRQCPGSPAGKAGFVVTSRTYSMEGMLYLGELDGEVQDDGGTVDLIDLEGVSVQDIGVQMGALAGATHYHRIPAFQMQAKIVPGDGREMIAFSGMGTVSPTQSTIPGAARSHTF